MRWPSWLLRGQCGHGQSAREAASTRSVCSYCMTPPDAHRTPRPQRTHTPRRAARNSVGRPNEPKHFEGAVSPPHRNASQRKTRASTLTEPREVYIHTCVYDIPQFAAMRAATRNNGRVPAQTKTNNAKRGNASARASRAPGRPSQHLVTLSELLDTYIPPATMTSNTSRGTARGRGQRAKQPLNGHSPRPTFSP